MPTFLKISCALLDHELCVPILGVMIKFGTKVTSLADNKALTFSNSFFSIFLSRCIAKIYLFDFRGVLFPNIFDSFELVKTLSPSRKIIFWDIMLY